MLAFFTQRSLTCQKHRTLTETLPGSPIWIVALVIPLFIIAVVAFFFWSRFTPRYDPREPPVLPQKVPFLGHVFGLLQHGLKYYTIMSSKHNLPIYTLQMLNQRTYIVNSPELVIAVQRNTKTLSFQPFVAAMLPKLFLVDETAMNIVKRNMDADEGNWGLIPDTHKETWPALAPGPQLDLMVQNMLSTLLPFLDELANPGEATATTDLYAWVRRAFTLAGTETLYGPENPFRWEPGLEHAFWAFEKDATFLLLGVAPGWIASKAHTSRQMIFNAMQRYFSRGGHDNSSYLTKARYNVYVKNGLSSDSIAHFELSSIIGLLINVTPTVFWLLFYIYSTPGLLKDVRQEVANATSTEMLCTQDDRKEHSISVVKLRENCPLLLSTYRETLRLKTNNVYTRWVRQDTLLNERYFLKQGSIVQVPGASMHADPALWGADVKEFKPRRFMKGEATHHRPGAFRSFGGGTSLCPGRHFALIEVLATAAMFVMRYDMEPQGGGGRWEEPKMEGNDVVGSIMPPTSRFDVAITTREGYEGDKWGFVEVRS